MTLPPLARSAAHACLLQVFGDDFARLAPQAAGKVITDLLDMARDEGFTDLYGACLEYARRIRPGSLTNTPGCCHPVHPSRAPIGRRIPDAWQVSRQ